MNEVYVLTTIDNECIDAMVFQNQEDCRKEFQQQSHEYKAEQEPDWYEDKENHGSYACDGVSLGWCALPVH